MLPYWFKLEGVVSDNANSYQEGIKVLIVMFVAFADFHCVNTPIVTDFKPGAGKKYLKVTVGSEEPEQAGSSTPPGAVNCLSEHSRQLWSSCLTVM